MDQVSQKLEKKLSRYIRDPQVSVRVIQFRSHQIHVLGSVKTPGTIPISDKPINIMEAINIAGAIDPESANPEYIYVIRGSYLQPQVYWLNESSPQAMLVAEHFYLRNNDIVYVSEVGIASFNRVLNKILPSLQTLFLTKQLADIN